MLKLKISGLKKSRTQFIRSTKVRKSNAFAYFSILKLAYLCCLSKNCNAKVSVANFSAPNKLGFIQFGPLEAAKRSHNRQKMG